MAWCAVWAEGLMARCALTLGAEWPMRRGRTVRTGGEAGGVFDYPTVNALVGYLLAETVGGVEPAEVVPVSALPSVAED
ncbi:hypothetical protein CLM84_09805, partial [Streptomyces albidoflavus]